MVFTPSTHTRTQQQFDVSELQFQLLPESIWWQRTQHVSPPLSLMQACGFFWVYPGSVLLRSSGHLSPYSVNESQLLYQGHRRYL